jgi:hypothetical protein
MPVTTVFLLFIMFLRWVAKVGISKLIKKVLDFFFKKKITTCVIHFMRKCTKNATK